MIDRTTHVEELMDAAQFLLRRKASGMSPLRGNHITPSQWLVIGYVFQHEGVSTNKAATALHMTGSAVTQLVNGLVAKGYVKRKQNPDDRRAYRLVVSAESKKRIIAFKKKRVLMILHMFKALTDKEFKQYVTLNKKILASISAT